MVVLRAVDVEKTRIDAMGNEPVRTCAREVRTDSAVTSLPEEGVNTAAQSGSSVKVASSQSISRLHRSRTGRPADMKSEIARIYGQLSYSAARRAHPKTVCAAGAIILFWRCIPTDCKNSPVQAGMRL